MPPRHTTPAHTPAALRHTFETSETPADKNRAEALTAFRDLGSEVDVGAVFGAEVGVVSQRRAQTAAPTTTGLVATLLMVDVWTDVSVTRRKHAPHQDLTLGCIES